MAYLTLADAKEYLGIAAATTSEDSLLSDLLAAAQSSIEQYCDRVFEAASDTTRVLDASIEAQGRWLNLPHDLAQITSIINGDTASTAFAASDYHTAPTDPPYSALMLKPDVVLWQGDISITGRWASSVAPPAAIAQATRDYVAFLYRAVDRQADAAQAVRTLGIALPAHVRHMLEPYRRLR